MPTGKLAGCYHSLFNEEADATNKDSFHVSFMFVGFYFFCFILFDLMSCNEVFMVSSNYLQTLLK